MYRSEVNKHLGQYLCEWSKFKKKKKTVYWLYDFTQIMMMVKKLTDMKSM